jgi:hypothetical protein
MAKLTRAQKRKLAEAQKFRATVNSLRCIAHSDWNDWEWDWLESEARRAPDYIYSENERGVLAQLIFDSATFIQYADYTVPELIAIAHPHRAELDEDGQGFVEKLHVWDAADLKRRQIKWLAGICRRTELIGRDPLVDARRLPPET